MMEETVCVLGVFLEPLTSLQPLLRPLVMYIWLTNISFFLVLEKTKLLILLNPFFYSAITMSVSFLFDWLATNSSAILVSAFSLAITLALARS